MRSVMSHQFSQVPQADIQRSSFDRSHGLKTTFDSGFLIPVFWDEVLPGDTFNLNMTAFARLSTPLHPFMDNLRMDSFFFFVPNRLIWDHWEKFNGAQDNPGDSTDFLVPQLAPSSGGGFANGSIFDYFGLPTQVDSIKANALHFRAYNLIWNDWFRDENLQNSVTVLTDDGPDPLATYALLRRGKRHDYFTSCLPWPQKGTAVELPLGTSAPVISTGSAMTFSGVGATPLGLTAAAPAVGVNWSAATTAAGPALYAAGLQTDLTNATAATINSLRQAFQIQKLYERDARGGTRYIEILKSHFGVTSPDFRLQRPEYLGGGSTPVVVSPIAQTSATGATGTPQGNLAAMGTVAARGNGFVKSFVEHGVVVGLVSVRADLTYQQGLDRMWSRQGRFDYFWPALAHIGEQAVLNQEIYAQGTGADTAAFGYQERFAEYRYKASRITGQFRSNYAQTLDSWHLSLDFGALPVLNASFIQDQPPISRVVAVTTAPQFMFDSYFNFRCARPMPVYGVPGLIDHF